MGQDDYVESDEKSDNNNEDDWENISFPDIQLSDAANENEISITDEQTEEETTRTNEESSLVAKVEEDAILAKDIILRAVRTEDGPEEPVIQRQAQVIQEMIQQPRFQERKRELDGDDDAVIVVHQNPGDDGPPVAEAVVWCALQSYNFLLP